MRYLSSSRLWRVLLGVLLAGVLFWLSRRLPLLAMLEGLQRQVAALGSWGGVAFPFLYATCNILLLPGGALAIGSGLFFGLWWGAFLNVVGSSLGAAVAFSLSRWAFRDHLRQRLMLHPRGAALDRAVAQNGWRIVFLTQLHPLAPTSLLNYLYGATSIRFGTCMLWVALGQVPGAFLYAYLGTIAQLGLRLLRGQSHPGPIEYIVWIGGLLLTAWLTIALGKFALRLIAAAEASVIQEPEFTSGKNDPLAGETVKQVAPIDCALVEEPSAQT